MLCNNCLLLLTNKITRDDTILLKTLYKAGHDSQSKAIPRDEIINKSGLTIARLNDSIIRLEFAGLITRNTFTKPQQFFINESGKKILPLLKEV